MIPGYQTRVKAGLWALRAHAALVYIFLYLPIVILVSYSFSASRFAAVWGGFSLQWYGRLFENTALLAALRNTLILGFTSTLIATVLGTAAALGLARVRKAWRPRLEALFYLPIIIPDVVLAISLLMLFVLVLQMQLSLFTMMLAHVVFCLCYVAVVVGARIRTLDPLLEEAARDLGAGSWQVFLRIKLPLLWPGILGGALLSLALSLDEFVISYFVAGPQSTTLPIAVYAMVKRGVTPEINALATLLLATSIILASLSFFVQRK